MLDFATGVPEFARAVTEAHQAEAYKHRWTRRFDEMRSEERGKPEGIRIFPRSEVERRRAFLEHAMEAAHAEGITLDEWVRAQRIDPALSERAEWAGLNDDALTAMERRRRRHAA